MIDIPMIYKQNKIMTCKNLMYISAAIFFLAATICISVFTYTHISKARVTCGVSDNVSISAYVDKDNVEEVGDLFSVSIKGVKNGKEKSYK